MSRKSKIDPVEKIKIVERVLANQIGIREAALLIGVCLKTIQRWRDLYLSDGSTALMDQSKNKVYSQELKRQAVFEYLGGESSLADIVIKYHLAPLNQDKILNNLYYMVYCH